MATKKIEGSDKSLIKKMREEGCKYQEIGNAFGITRERVRQILKKLDSSLCGRELPFCSECFKTLTCSEVVRATLRGKKLGMGKSARVCDVCDTKRKIKAYGDKWGTFIEVVEDMRSNDVTWVKIHDAIFPDRLNRTDGCKSSIMIRTYSQAKIRGAALKQTLALLLKEQAERD